MPDGAAPIPPFRVESLSEREQRLSFRVGDSWCRATSFELTSGMRLGVSACQYEASFAFSVVQPPSQVELIISKGAWLAARTDDGHDLELAGSALHLGRVNRNVPLTVRPRSELQVDCVGVSLTERRLNELLGTETLPDCLQRVLGRQQSFSIANQAMTPRLFDLLDEVTQTNVKSSARLLWHEAKALELVALVTDELTEAAPVARTHLSQRDVEGLERARRCLLADLQAAPTLKQLAREAGMSETKLKQGFAALFGSPVFSYLRSERLAAARRLLLAGGLGVTEVADRVGYQNPSKFAAAFRLEFGVTPSSLRP